MASIARPSVGSPLAERLLTDLLDLSALVASADVDRALRHVAELSARHLADDDLQVGVSLVRNGRVETGVWLGDAVCRIDGAQYDSDDDGPCVDAIRTGEIHEVRDMLRDRRWPDFARTAVDSGVHSSLSLPLVAWGEALGAINVYAPHPEAFDQRSRTVGATLADHGALALTTARAFAQARQAGVTLQRNLLPRHLPAMPGVRLAVRYLPASAGINVGGDWYDAIETGQQSMMLAVGDVAGHGLTAAPVMGQLRIGLRAYVSEGHGPARSLDLLHELFTDLEPDLIATVCCVLLEQLDAGQVQLRWSTAGHPAPLLLEPRSLPRYLEGSPSPPVGTPPSGASQERRHTLERGSTLILFTDGLIERRGRSLDDGLRRLADAAATAPRDPEALCDRLLDHLLAGDTHDDDIALLAVTLSAPESTTI